jgi:uncharacterized DUF497 family protein
MTDAGFDWDDGNRWKDEDHGLDSDEVQEVFDDPDRIPAPAYNTRGERRWALIGATASDRVLFVVYTRRGKRIRVISAYPADEKAQRAYWNARSKRR